MLLLFTRGSWSINLVIYLPTGAEKEHINSLINSQAVEAPALQGSGPIFLWEIGSIKSQSELKGSSALLSNVHYYYYKFPLCSSWMPYFFSVTCTTPQSCNKMLFDTLHKLNT